LVIFGDSDISTLLVKLLLTFSNFCASKLKIYVLTFQIIALSLSSSKDIQGLREDAKSGNHAGKTV
jgi:hypothetical protein